MGVEQLHELRLPLATLGANDLGECSALGGAPVLDAAEQEDDRRPAVESGTLAYGDAAGDALGGTSAIEVR